MRCGKRSGRFPRRTVIGVGEAPPTLAAKESGEVGSAGVGSRRRSLDQSFEWVPSQKTGLAVCLHPHRYAVPVSVASNRTGVWSVTLWLPSQKGWLALRPQEHQK